MEGVLLLLLLTILLCPQRLNVPSTLSLSTYKLSLHIPTTYMDFENDLNNQICTQIYFQAKAYLTLTSFI